MNKQNSNEIPQKTNNANGRIQEILNQVSNKANPASNDNPTNIDKKCKYEIMSKINPEILNKMGITTEDVENFLSSSSPEPFEIVEAF